MIDIDIYIAFFDCAVGNRNDIDVMAIHDSSE